MSVDIQSALVSMTGQGVGEAAWSGATRVSVELRTVNHRYLDVRVRAPNELPEASAIAEDVAKRMLHRGRVEIVVSLEGGDALPPPVLDVARARAAFEQLVALRDALAPREPVPLQLLATVPELFVSRNPRKGEQLRIAIREACERAAQEAHRMRLREGQALAEDFRLRLTRIEGSLASIERRLPEVIVQMRLRLHERVARLLDPNPMDRPRLEQEVVVFADRSDVTEECTRLRSHIAQFRSVLTKPMEGRGKRIDFLCQEIARETNTLGQKSSDASLATFVIDMKVEIERMREQAQNVL
jgi:uncharacterized protein (TIGR00255 family)